MMEQQPPYEDQASSAAAKSRAVNEVYQQIPNFEQIRLQRLNHEKKEEETKDMMEKQQPPYDVGDKKAREKASQCLRERYNIAQKKQLPSYEDQASLAAAISRTYQQIPNFEHPTGNINLDEVSISASLGGGIEEVLNEIVPGMYPEVIDTLVDSSPPQQSLGIALANMNVNTDENALLIRGGMPRVSRDQSADYFVETINQTVPANMREDVARRLADLYLPQQQQQQQQPAEEEEQQQQPQLPAQQPAAQLPHLPAAPPRPPPTIRNTDTSAAVSWNEWCAPTTNFTSDYERVEYNAVSRRFTYNFVVDRHRCRGSSNSEVECAKESDDEVRKHFGHLNNQISLNFDTDAAYERAKNKEKREGRIGPFVTCLSPPCKNPPSGVAHMNDNPGYCNGCHSILSGNLVSYQDRLAKAMMDQQCRIHTKSIGVRIGSDVTNFAPDMCAIHKNHATILEINYLGHPDAHYDNDVLRPEYFQKFFKKYKKKLVFIMLYHDTQVPRPWEVDFISGLWKGPDFGALVEDINADLTVICVGYKRNDPRYTEMVRKYPGNVKRAAYDKEQLRCVFVEDVCGCSVDRVVVSVTTRGSCQICNSKRTHRGCTCEDCSKYICDDCWPVYTHHCCPFFQRPTRYKRSRRREWDRSEYFLLKELFTRYGNDWDQIAHFIRTRSVSQVKSYGEEKFLVGNRPGYVYEVVKVNRRKFERKRKRIANESTDQP